MRFTITMEVRPPSGWPTEWMRRIETPADAGHKVMEILQNEGWEVDAMECRNAAPVARTQG